MSGDAASAASGPGEAWASGARPAWSAQLRVYEPLAAFPPAERERWRAYAAAGTAPSTAQGPAVERAAGTGALLGLRPSYVPEVDEHAYVREVDGVTLVCPWRTRVRSWQALVDARAELPAVLVDALVPPAVVDDAAARLAAWREQEPDQHVHVLSSTWQVPVRWFVLVDAGEREVSRGARSGPAGPAVGRSLVYRTAMSRARRRAARALAVLRRTLDDGAAALGVEDLGRWLEEFHPRSLVELDYGGLVHLLDDEALDQDESAADVAEALAALGAGDGERAGAAYARVTSRMKHLQSVERAG